MDDKLKSLIELYNKKNFLDLVRKATEFVQENSSSAMVWNLLALGHRYSGNVQEARKIYDRLLKLNPDNFLLNTNAGNLFLSIGKLNDAVECFNKALETEPDHITTLEAAAIALGDLGQAEKAKEYFRRVIEIDENYQSARYHLARILVREQSYREAIDHFELTEYGLSKSHQLECIYHLGEKKLFFEKYNSLIAAKKINPLMASIGAHSAIRYSVPDINPFCRSPLNFIKKFNISTADGFNQQLIDQIIGYHKSAENDFRTQPLLKKGEQSSGNLFLLEMDFIQDLQKLILQKVNEYRKCFPKSNEGFLKFWPDKFTLYGWLVAIKTGGHLAPHIHKEGWLSGSLYFNLPKKPNSDEGNISFSVDGADYPKDGKEFPSKTVDIEKGDLVLFPSSLFHKTIPFSGTEERVSFAFDVIPSKSLPAN